MAEQAILRLTLRGQARTVDARVEYDSVRFLAPGRNPVTLMAAVFARFLPHLTLNQASVHAAEARRQSWVFGGYLPNPGRTDQLLVTMAQESWCTVYKDLDGVYQISADDPDVQPVLSLQADRDVVRESLGLTWLPMDEVYTDFYLWYGRVTQATTTVPAGQYAAVLYVTPDASISANPDLQPLCQQVAMSLRTRKRFDYYADLISDPPTADRLLDAPGASPGGAPGRTDAHYLCPGTPSGAHGPRAGAWGPARSPAMGGGRAPDDAHREPRPARVGGDGALAPGRRCGAGCGKSGNTRRSHPPCAWSKPWDAVQRTLLETWEDEGAPTGGPWYFQSDFAALTPTVPCLYAMCGYANTLAFAGTQQVHGAGGKVLDESTSTQTQAPAWFFANRRSAVVAGPRPWSLRPCSGGGRRSTATTRAGRSRSLWP